MQPGRVFSEVLPVWSETAHEYVCEEHPIVPPYKTELGYPCCYPLELNETNLDSSFLQRARRDQWPPRVYFFFSRGTPIPIPPLNPLNAKEQQFSNFAYAVIGHRPDGIFDVFLTTLPLGEEKEEEEYGKHLSVYLTEDQFRKWWQWLMSDIVAYHLDPLSGKLLLRGWKGHLHGEQWLKMALLVPSVVTDQQMIDVLKEMNDVDIEDFILGIQEEGWQSTVRPPVDQWLQTWWDKRRQDLEMEKEEDETKEEIKQGRIQELQSFFDLLLSWYDVD